MFSFFSSYSARSICFRHTHYRTYFLILLRYSHFFLYHNDFDMHSSLSIYETTNQTTQMVFTLTGLCIKHRPNQNLHQFLHLHLTFIAPPIFVCLPTNIINLYSVARTWHIVWRIIMGTLQFMRETKIIIML